MKQKSWCTDNRTDVKENLQRSCWDRMQKIETKLTQ
jgi:hypothetical protein